MSAMKDLSVDLTSLLVAKEKAAEKLYKFDGGGDGNHARNAVQLHIHETDIECKDCDL